jgi:hypothetical protein
MQPRGERTGARDALILLLSGAIVIAGAAAARRAPLAGASPGSAEGPGLPPPLPSGAPPRGLEDLPTDDERADGCHFAERGFGDYVAWRKLPTGRALVPEGRGVAADGSFRLLVHFHGAEPVRRQLAPEGFDLVIVGVDAGVGSRAYDHAFADPGAFPGLVAAAEAEVARAAGLGEAHARGIVLSSWSAGYGAVAQILARRDPRVEAVVLLDSLYAAYANGKRSVDRGQLAPFVEAARTARAGGPAFVFTYTQIATPGYASTGEVASFLLTELGVTATAAGIDDTRAPGSLRFSLLSTYEEGRLRIRGYAGADRDAHCAQLHLLPSVLREAVLPGWK